MVTEQVLEQAPVFPGQGGWVNNIISLIIAMLFFLMIFFGQQIQGRLALLQISGALRRLEFMRNDAKALALKTIKEVGRPKDDPTQHFNMLLEQFLVMPVDLDPTGIIPKLDHLINVRESRMRFDVSVIAPEASETQRWNLENLVEAVWALNLLYRLVRHFYLLGRKTSSYILIIQLQMLLPLIMQEAEAFMGATKAFAAGHPIGDGIGALVAARLMAGREIRKVEKDMVVAEVPIEGRRILALKAEGPGGNVGRPGDAVRQLIEENEGRIALVITVDAGLKLEGEATGEIAEGVGVAIGGIGTERYKIEEEATKHKIPYYAIIIKESILDAITTMKKEIIDAADKVIERIKALILNHTQEGDTVIVAGIGNTIGIGQ